MFGLFKRKNGRKELAAGLYRAVVERARTPVFYRDGGVPDTLDGRFDMILLHVILLIRSLGRNNQPEIAQALFDAMFTNMELALRESGVGDLGVPKHMKRMIKAYYGRYNAYDSALDSGSAEDLSLALERNLYGRSDAGRAGLEQMTLYVLDCARHTKISNAGDVDFPPLPFIGRNAKEVQTDAA